MLHYPPPPKAGQNRNTELMEAAGHSTASTATCMACPAPGLTGTHRSAYHLVACDAIGFKPLYVTSLPG